MRDKPVGDERAEFEAFAIERTWSINRRKDGEYEDGCTFIGWIVWQAARAGWQAAQPTSAMMEEAALRVAVRLTKQLDMNVAWRVRIKTEVLDILQFVFGSGVTK